MALMIDSPRVEALAGRLARLTHLDTIDAVALALENELRKRESAPLLDERIRHIQDRILARPATGLAADKAFFDDLSGEP